MVTTPYGIVTWSPDHVYITADGMQLWEWAHRPNASWPCSILGRLEMVNVTFDRSGIVDMTSQPENGTEDLSGDELSAWSSDVLKLAGLPEDHPTYLVTVGQFADKLTCPECGEPVWDLPKGSKLAKCWNAEGHASGDPLAFDTMTDETEGT